MGRSPCCDKANVKKGQWSPEEDAKLKEYMEKHGSQGNWITLPLKAGLRRCGKSCRLRWLNYLRPNLKHGEFSDDENGIICSLFASIGSRWSIIAGQLPGRTDNDIKNYWNTKLRKKFLLGMVPSMQQKIPPQPTIFPFPQNPSVESPYSTSNRNYYTSSRSSSLQDQVINAGSGFLQTNQMKDSYLISFGSGGEASFTSSDGFSSHLSSAGMDENQKFMLGINSESANADVYENPTDLQYYEESLDYSIDIMKQLINLH